jgi:transcriptional regulator with XRE-family HTH domain
VFKQSAQTLLRMDGIEKRFGDRVRQLRTKKGWTQDEFADVSGFHRAYIGTVERGETNISVRNVETLAKALGVKIAELFRGLDS